MYYSLEDLNNFDKQSWSRIAVEHDDTPTLFYGSFSTKTFLSIPSKAIKLNVKSNNQELTNYSFLY